MLSFSSNTTKSANLSWSSHSNMPSATAVKSSGPDNYGTSNGTNAPLIPVVPSANQELEKMKTMQQRRSYRVAPKPGSGYVCRRCGSTEHYLENCPTNGDPNFDKARQVTAEQDALFYSKESSATLPSGKVGLIAISPLITLFRCMAFPRAPAISLPI